MARNVLRGGGRAWRTEVQGLKELERQLKALSADNPELKPAMYEAVGAAAAQLRQDMVAAAHAAGWDREFIQSGFGKYAGSMTGSDVIDHIFSFDKPRDSGRSKISAIAGVTKRANSGRGTMISWRAGKRGRTGWVYKDVVRKVAYGNEVAMSFATMLEFGTSNRPPHPAIRPAVDAAKAGIVATIAEKWKELLERFAK